MKVDIGSLNKRIQIISQVKTTDDDGFDITTEKVIRKCWASFNRTSGTETIKANADFNEVKCRFMIRYNKIPISSKYQVRYNNQIYEIVYANDYNDSHEYIELICSKIALGD